MPGALQIVNTFKQGLSGGGAFDNFASGTGDIVTASDGSLIVPGFPDGAICALEEIWAKDDADALVVSLIGPDFHDRIRGLEAIAPWELDANSVSMPQNVSPGSISQKVSAGNQFFVTGADQNAGNANIVFLLRYSNLPGVKPVLASAQAVKDTALKPVGVTVAVDGSTGAGGQGDWSAPAALTSVEGRRLDGAKYYAVVGFTADAPLAAACITSFETGNTKIGAPVVGRSEHDAYSLWDVADRYADALIPLIKGYSQDQVQVQVADPSVTTANVVVQLVEVPKSLYDAAQALAS